MKHWLFFIAALLSLCAAILTATAWVESYRDTLHLRWTSSQTLHQISSSCGKLHLVRFDKFWFQVPLTYEVEQGFYAPIEMWPGFMEPAERRLWGFRLASGKYVTSYCHVTEETKFTSAEFRNRVTNGTMLSITVPFRAWSVPFWFLAAFCAILPVWWGVAKLRRRKPHPVTGVDSSCTNFV